MGATATFDQSTLEVEPGGQVSGQLTVRNTGDVVDEFSFEVLGDAAGWTVVDPATLRLFPNTEQSATVRFQPPRAPTTPVGEVPFGIKVVPTEDPGGSAVAEGSLQVAPFSDVFAELLPHTSKGRRSAKHELAVDNRGNERVNADVTAVDQEDVLDFDVDPPGMVSEPGTASFGTLKVSSSERHWRGPPVSRPFQVMVHPDGEEPLELDGTMVQEAMIPSWLPKALLALLLLLALLAVLWFTLLRPTLESAAREAVEEPLEELSEQNAAQDEQIQAAAQQASEAQQDGDGSAAGGEATPEPTPEPTTTEVAFDDRLAASDGTGDAVGTDTFTVGSEETLRLTDVLLENPQGHAGFVRLLRNDGVLVEVALENFRSLDYHFVSPVVFAGDDVLVLEVECAEPAEGADECDAAAYVTGRLVTPVEEDGGG